MSELRIVEWSQGVYADMEEKCWTIVDDQNREVAGTFWSRHEAEDYLSAMTPREPDHHDLREAERQRDDEALRQADMTVRYPEGL